ncbi:hypothetical protein O6H91_07G008100 [Diphasiastrum complanatum]|uniref:Uncharacterized protein n=1 Tax=Diphasiastrum complanatum TaxID=34168 RepID=A0ACC2D2L7_DIPCM|nr:hypothetical protein O6H91_07G008100 [Diphasiastrum complanatum]
MYMYDLSSQFSPVMEIRPSPSSVRRIICSMLFLLVVILRSTNLVLSHQGLVPSPQFPAIFTFGDSVLEAGNNNHLVTLAKANFPPNGIDFPEGATGRFCNGKTILDIICERIGLPHSPPFLDPGTTGTKILRGVNYASGGGGILKETGANFLLGKRYASILLSRSLFSVGMGNNDYLNNYLLLGSPTRKQFTPEEFKNHLLSTLSSQLREVYDLGARKFMVFSVAPLGCIPSQLALRSSDGSCLDDVNYLTLDFNAGLQNMLTKLNDELPDAKFKYVDVYGPLMQLVSNPSLHGFSTGKVACCGNGRFNGQIPCLISPLGNLCSDRTDFVFWDPFHTSEVANIILANQFYDQFMAGLNLD